MQFITSIQAEVCHIPSDFSHKCIGLVITYMFRNQMINAERNILMGFFATTGWGCAGKSRACMVDIYHMEFILYPSENHPFWIWYLERQMLQLDNSLITHKSVPEWSFIFSNCFWTEKKTRGNFSSQTAGEQHELRGQGSPFIKSSLQISRGPFLHLSLRSRRRR